MLRYLLMLGLLLLVACGTPTPAQTTSSYDDTVGETRPEPESPEGGDSLPPAPTPEQAGAAAPGERPTYSAPPAMVIDPARQYTATIETTKGAMEVELFPEDAPMTVNNFVVLARDDFYDGVRFHRIIEDFMVQTGDPQGDGTGGPGYRFDDEPVTRPYSRGTLAMANAGPNTNGSQFFIVHAADAGLPPSYTIFGALTDGLDVLDAIATVPVGPNSMSGEQSVPQEEVLITNITIHEQ
jgi:cyclophilin family peptidyl-prolyl cis-trans isomerase